MDRRAWRATVHGVTESWTRLSDKHTQTYPCLTVPYLKAFFLFTLSLWEILSNRMALKTPVTPTILTLSSLDLPL